jgi:hypothetical protein
MVQQYRAAARNSFCAAQGCPEFPVLSSCRRRNKKVGNKARAQSPVLSKKSPTEMGKARRGFYDERFSHGNRIA